MWRVLALVVVAVVVSGAVGQQGRVSYDGTPLNDSPKRAFFRGVPFGFDSSPAPLSLSQPVGTFTTSQQPAFTSPIVPQPHSSHGTCGPFSSPLVDECYGSQAYHLSWRHNPGREFTWQEAQDYCEHLGFAALSIEQESEDSFIASIITIYNIRDIWTSGRRVGYDNWAWISHSSSGYTNWSHTGRLGRSQPDNVEGEENCLSVGYNLYHDGVRWHDVRCSYRKYVICEAPLSHFLH